MSFSNVKHNKAQQIGGGIHSVSKDTFIYQSEVSLIIIILILL